MVLLFLVLLTPSSVAEGSSAGILDTATKPPNIIVHFNGTMYGNANPWYPADVQIAAGPVYVVETVNSVVTVYTKQGTLAKATTLQSFFGVGGHFFDSRVLYDTSSQRWFLSTEDFLTGIIYLAVSKTTDPTSGWWTFPINSTQACIPDQPTLGVSDDKIAVSVNGCLGVQYWIFNKSDLLAGQNVYSTSILGFDVYAVHPAQALSSTTTLYMITTYDGHPDSARLFRVTGVPPGPITINATDLSLSPMTSPPKAPQLGSFYRLDTGDNRVLDAKWDRGMLWISLNDGCIPTADNQTRSCVRLIQIDTRTLHVAQDFDIGAPGQYYYYPAVSPDRRGNLLVVFGEASLTSYPSMMVSAQTAVDRDSLGQPVIVAAGSAPDLSSCTVDRGCRYGDYFEAARDPSNPAIVWVAGQYGTVASTFPPSLTWATVLAALSIHRSTL